MQRTSIEWVKNPDGTQGFTWNPITGCLNHVEGMCKGGNFPCYAYRLANRRLKSRYLANKEIYVKDVLPGGEHLFLKALADPFYPRFWEDRLTAGYAFMQNHKPMGIFPCDMSDWCGIGIPESWSDWIIEMAIRCPQHRFYLLTKQPQNLIKWSPFPDNVWLGVSATNQQQFDNAVKYLKEVDATVKFISFEPLLEKINFDL